jgi:hypothetical protein
MKLTRAEVDQQLAEERETNGLLHMAINYLLRDEVRWFKSGAYKVGVIDPNRMDGGIVIVNYQPRGQKPYASAYYLESWLNAELRRVTTYPTEQDLYEAAIMVSAYRYDCQKAAA